MQDKNVAYWQEGIDSKALLVCFLQKLPYLLLLGVTGAVLGSGLYLLIAVMTSEGPKYQAETEYYIDFAEGRIDAKDYYNDIVIGSDTIVAINNEVLEKPVDEKDAYRMLKLLNNNTHEVITGVCIKTKEYCKTFKTVTKVTFMQMSEEEIRTELQKIRSETGASSVKEMGKVMGAAQKAFAGRADNKVVSTIVKELLG